MHFFFTNSINLHNTDFADFLLFFHHLAEECAENGFQSSSGAESRKSEQSRLDRPEKNDQTVHKMTKCP